MSTENIAIDASPTKEFFIQILVKDISLLQVIPDLVDNSVDGALRLRGSEHFEGLWVRIEIDKEKFKISDNCGGISVDHARNYAFRFGRTKEVTPVPHAIGQFGVGMKRAIFKLGTKVRIESKTANSRFVIEEDINNWISKDEWEFKFKELDEISETPIDEQGTSIIVTALHESVAQDFSLDPFQTRLKQELEAKHQMNMAKGLVITLNGLPLNTKALEILNSSELQPGITQIEYPSGDHNKPIMVIVKLYAGLGESKPEDCGWYIFCNGRLVLQADKTSITGWGTPGIPNYHNQFNRFRGYAFFDCDDASLLPWNTTKNGVDSDSIIYRAVRQEMITLMRPVITFLNKLKEERTGKGIQDEEEVSEPGPLEVVLKEAKLANPLQLPLVIQGFETKPRSEAKDNQPKHVTISYRKPEEEVKLVKDSLGAVSYRELGEKTFDYYLAMECT